MKQKQQSHLRGQRGQAFAKKIRGIFPEQILCVSIDISKDFHVVLLHNGLGEIITPSFEIDIFRTGEAAKKRYKPLFATDFWTCQRWQQLIRVCPNPRHVAALSPVALIDAFHAQGFPMGPVWAKRFIAYAEKSLWPDPEVAAIRCQWLASDLVALDGVSARIAAFTQQIDPLLAQTPYHFLTRVKGVTATTAASFAAAVGDPAHYNNARQVFRRSGLVSGRDDSGARQRQGAGTSVTKAGDVYLRRALNNISSGLILHQPVLSTYYHRLKQTKKPGVARVAVIRRAVGILWATLRDHRADPLILKRAYLM